MAKRDAFAPVFTDAQRQLVYRMREEGKTGRAIAEACHEGTGGLEPFDISPESVYTIARRERLRIMDRDIPAAQAHTIAASLLRRMIVVARAEVDDLEKMQRQGRGKLNVKRMGEVVAILDRLEKAAKRLPAQDPDTPAPQPDDANGTREPDADNASAFYAQLADDDDTRAADGNGKATGNGQGTDTREQAGRQQGGQG